MARYPLPTFEPDTNVPFALRLAQFLLGASDQVQQYGTNVEQQGKSALATVDSMERSADRKSLIDQRKFEFDTKQAAAADEAKTKELKRNALSKFLNVSPTMEVSKQIDQPVDRLPQDANDLQRPPDVMSLLTKSSRKRDFNEATQAAGLSPAEFGAIGSKDTMDALKSLFPGEPANKFSQGSMGVVNTATGDIKERAAEQKGRLTQPQIDLLAAKAQKKIALGETPEPDELAALDAFNLRASTNRETSAVQGMLGHSADLQTGPIPQTPPINRNYPGYPGPPSQPGPTPPPIAPGASPKASFEPGPNVSPDFRDPGMLTGVLKGGAVDQAAQRDLVTQAPPATPTTPIGRGPSLLEQKTLQKENTEYSAKQGQNVGAAGSGYVLKSTGLAPPPTMPLDQVQKEGVLLSPQQQTAISALRRGLAELKEGEDQHFAGLFPEAPFKGKGIGAVLGNAGRAITFNVEARLRSMSQPEYADLITWFAAARPALAKATGEVGNLSESEQATVKEAMGITRTREAFASGLKTYRRILERGFAANGVPIPEPLRLGGKGDLTPYKAPDTEAAADAFIQKKGLAP